MLISKLEHACKIKLKNTNQYSPEHKLKNFEANIIENTPETYEDNDSMILFYL